MPPVDLVDDVQVTRQQVLEEVDGPALQGFRQDSVIGVGTGMNHNVPGLDTEGTGGDQRQESVRPQTLSHIWLQKKCRFGLL